MGVMLPSFCLRLARVGQILLSFFLIGSIFFHLDRAAGQQVPPATGVCVEGCPKGGGGGSIDPPAPGPSPEEIRAQEKLERKRQEAQVLTEKGLEAQKGKDWETAAAYFRRALEKTPGDKSIEQQLKRAEAEIERERTRRAVQGRVNSLYQSLTAPTTAKSGLDFDAGSQGAASQGLQFATGPSAPSGASAGGLDFVDSNVVDLRDAKTLTLDPAKVKGGRQSSSGGLEFVDSNMVNLQADPQREADRTHREAIQKLRGQVAGIQEALRRLNLSMLSDARQRAEWEKVTNEAMQNAWDRGKGMVVDEGINFLGKRIENQLASVNQELQRAVTRLSGETDPARRDRLHAAVKLLGQQREQIRRAQKEAEPILQRLRETKLVLDTADYARSNPGDLEKFLRGSYDLVKMALDNPTVQKSLKIGGQYGAGAGYAQSVVDSSYDITAEAIAWKRISQLNRNSEQYLEAVNRLKERMEKTVQKIQGLEKMGK